MGDAANSGSQGRGGQVWRREDVVGEGWTQDTGNRKNKMEKEGKIMIRKPQLNDKVTQKTPIKATTEDLGGAREDKGRSATAGKRAQQGKGVVPSPEFHPQHPQDRRRKLSPISYRLASIHPKTQKSNKLKTERKVPVTSQAFSVP